jgi:D-alanyl-D-alanine carboxypeptidase
METKIQICLIITLLSSFTGKQTKTIMNEIDNVLAKEVRKNKTPSVQYVIFNRDSVMYRFRSGFADILNQKKVEDITTYNAYSVTKTFTALAVLQLAQQKKLDIDIPVKSYFPDFPYSSEITIRQLMTHSAGIPNPVPLSCIHLTDEHQSFDRNRFFNRIFIENNKTKSNPNEKYAYSNLGYVLLGQLIEKVSGLSYEDYIRENIFQPLNIRPNELDFTITEPDNHAKGYIKRFSFFNIILGLLLNKSKYMDKTEGKWKSFKNLYVNGTSYGGLIGTPDGFAKYLQELIRPDCKLIPDDYKKLLFTENHLNSGKKTGVCLSWFKGYLNGKEYFAHAGGGGGYYCEIRVYPEQGIGSVIMFNRTGMSDERFSDKVDKYFL